MPLAPPVEVRRSCGPRPPHLGLAAAGASSPLAGPACCGRWRSPGLGGHAELDDPEGAPRPNLAFPRPLWRARRAPPEGRGGGDGLQPRGSAGGPPISSAPTPRDLWWRRRRSTGDRGVATASGSWGQRRPERARDSCSSPGWAGTGTCRTTVLAMTSRGRQHPRRLARRRSREVGCGRERWRRLPPEPRLAPRSDPQGAKRKAPARSSSSEPGAHLTLVILPGLAPRPFRHLDVPTVGCRLVLDIPCPQRAQPSTHQDVPTPAA